DNDRISKQVVRANAGVRFGFQGFIWPRRGSTRSSGRAVQAMSDKRNLTSIVVGAVVLTMAGLALTNRPLRIWYHRMRLHSDMSFTPLGPKNVTDHRSLSYWKWRLLEHGRTAEKQLQRRQEIDVPRQTAAL